MPSISPCPLPPSSGGGDIHLASRGKGIGSLGVLAAESLGTGAGSRGVVTSLQGNGGCSGGGKARLRSSASSVLEAVGGGCIVGPPCTLRLCSDLEPDLDRCRFFSRT